MEGSDYQESTYSRAHDFTQARQYYDRNAGRSYSEAKKTGKTNADLLPKMIKSTRRFLFALIGDVTGSMGDAPGVYFSKYPYLLHEISTEYMGEDTDMLFGAFGDGNPPGPDEYPLQFRPLFQVTLDKTEAKKRILELITTEHGGGGQTKENSELAALYLLRNVSAPNAEKKVCIIITDESPYDYADKVLARQVAFVDLGQNMQTEDVFAELKKEGWDIYVIQRPYDNGCNETMDLVTARVHAKWASLLGDDYVAYLPDINRVVDVSFGILGDATDKYDYFMREIVDRQLKDDGGQIKIDATYKALRGIHLKHLRGDEKKEKNPGASKIHKKLDGKPGKKLL
jgi:hypothetical protein